MLGLAVVVTLAFSVGVLVAGPIYADAAREAILSSSLTARCDGRQHPFSPAATRLRLDGRRPRHPAGRVDSLPLERSSRRGRGRQSLCRRALRPEPRPRGRRGPPRDPGRAARRGEVAALTRRSPSFDVRRGDRSRRSVRRAGQRAHRQRDVLLAAPRRSVLVRIAEPVPGPRCRGLDAAAAGRRGIDAIVGAARDPRAHDPVRVGHLLDITGVPSRRPRLSRTIQSVFTSLQGGRISARLDHLTSGLDTLLEVVRQRIANLRVPILLVVFQIGAVTLAVLAGVGSLTLTRQSFELAVLHSRGFAPGVLLPAQALQAVLAAIVAYPLGLLLGLGLAKLASTSNGTRCRTASPIGLTRPPSCWGSAPRCSAPPSCWCSRSRTCRRTVLEQRRALRARTARRSCGCRSSCSSPRSASSRSSSCGRHAPKPGAGKIDPLVLLAPTLLIFAASFFALRLLLRVLRALDPGSAGRGAGAVPGGPAARAIARTGSRRPCCCCSRWGCSSCPPRTERSCCAATRTRRTRRSAGTGASRSPRPRTPWPRSAHARAHDAGRAHRAAVRGGTF